MWLRNNRVAASAILAVVLLPIAIAVVFFYAPVDEDGLNQKIFYFHVPIALTAYACFGWGAWKGLVHLWKGKPGADLESYVAIHLGVIFGWGAWKGLLHLWKGRPGADLESYVAIHLGVIFGAMTLVTGSLWAKFRWGHWWLWSERQLVLFLVLFLFYSAYFMLRYSVEPGPQRANLCAVYSLFGVVLIPISFLAIRLANQYIHPVAFNRHGPQMAGSQFVTFCVCLAAMLSLFVALYQFELAGKRLDARLRELRELLA